MVPGVQLAAAEADGAAHHCGQREDPQQDGPPLSLQRKIQILHLSLDYCQWRRQGMAGVGYSHAKKWLSPTMKNDVKVSKLN